MPELALKSAAVTLDGATRSASLHVDAQTLTIGFEKPLAIPLKDIASVQQRGRWVEILHGKRLITLEIGAEAEAWWRAIRYPKSLFEKLELKPDKRIWLVSLTDKGLVAEISALFPHVTTRASKQLADSILFGAEEMSALERLPQLREQIVQNGTIWVIYPKGIKTITESEVRAAGLAAGLVDTKICRVSETHTGLKFVIPVAQRTATSSPKKAAKGWTPKPARDAIALPDDIAKALQKQQSLWAFFTWLPASHQKAYVEYITEAKRPGTRANRIAETVERLRAEMGSRLR